MCLNPTSFHIVHINYKCHGEVQKNIYFLNKKANSLPPPPPCKKNPPPPPLKKNPSPSCGVKQQVPKNIVCDDTQNKMAKTLIQLFSAVMPPDNSQEYDIHLATALRGLTDLRKDLTAGKILNKQLGYLKMKRKILFLFIIRQYNLLAFVCFFRYFHILLWERPTRAY